MCSKPGGDRGPAVGYREHMNAFSELGKKHNITCEEIFNLKEASEISNFDIFIG